MPPAARSSVSWAWSFGCSHLVIVWQVARFLDGFKIVDIQLRGASGRREGEVGVPGRGASLPIANGQRELGRLVHGLAGDHVTAGVGRAALGDPDLPVGILGPEGQVIALL